MHVWQQKIQVNNRWLYHIGLYYGRGAMRVMHCCATHQGHIALRHPSRSYSCYCLHLRVTGPPKVICLQHESLLYTSPKLLQIFHVSFYINITSYAQSRASTTTWSVIHLIFIKMLHYEISGLNKIILGYIQ